ncbi:MAG: hypothetical protein IJ800_05500 [Clostridia bacterium]|nr:hypothetical protein [Clostridia bacterium]
MKLTDDEFDRVISMRDTHFYYNWYRAEIAEECLWKCADMTGQDVEISKIDDKQPNTANILWLRFVPMDEDEVKAHLETRRDRTVLAHMDEDFHQYDSPKSIRDYCKCLYSMKDSDVGIVAQEVSNDIAQFDYDPETVERTAFDEYRLEYSKVLHERRNEVYPEEITYAHKCGIKMFAAHRMQLANTEFLYSSKMYIIPFVSDHPELRCVSRDGTPCAFLSYAYNETQDFMINAMVENAEQGFDGLMHIWTRGQHIMFEEPVLQRFKEKFGSDVDCRRLPASDERLMEIRGDIIVEFYRKLKKKLSVIAAKRGSQPMKIYMQVYYDLKHSKMDGLDVERLAAEGLIDGFIQTKISVWEKTDDLIKENGLLDIGEYTKKAKREIEYIYERDTREDDDLMTAQIPLYRAIADKYGIDFYTDTHWENILRPDGCVKTAKRYFAAGAKSLMLWDCYPSRVVNLPEWNCNAQFGNADKVEKMSENNDDYFTVHKILSYNGQNLLYNHPNWRA